MTEQQFEEIKKISEEIDLIKKANEKLLTKIERIDEYISFLKEDGDTIISKITGKQYPKVEYQFLTGNGPTETDIKDYGFNVILENKEEFIKFLKACQKGYKRDMDLNNVRINSLRKQFEAA